MLIHNDKYKYMIDPFLRNMDYPKKFYLTILLLQLISIQDAY